MAHLLNLLFAQFVLLLLIIQKGGQLLLLLRHDLLLELLLVGQHRLHLRGDTRNGCLKAELSTQDTYATKGSRKPTSNPHYVNKLIVYLAFMMSCFWHF